MEKIVFEKQGEQAEIKRNKDLINITWGNQKGTITDILQDKQAIELTGINYEGQPVTGFTVDEEILKKVKQVFSEIEEEQKEKEHREKQKLENKIQKIKEKNKITLRWMQGSPLSGWTPATKADEGILYQLDAIEDIAGWGTKVKKIVEDMGSFKEIDNTTAIVEYRELKKRVDGEKATRQEKEKKIQDMQEKAIQEAKKTGKQVYVRGLGGYDGDVEKPGQELGWVSVSEYATPEGGLVSVENPTR